MTPLIKPIKQMFTGTDNQILSDRAQLKIDDIIAEQEDLIAGIKKEIRLKQADILRMTDFNKSQTTDLDVKDVESSKFVEQLHNIQVEITLKSVELKIAEDTLKALNGELNEEVEETK